MIRAVALIFLMATPLQAADFEFCWIGNNNYTMSGMMSVTDQALTQQIVTESDVTAFAISGTRNGLPIGNWSLDELTPTTSWNLNFDPAEMVFVTGGYSNTTQGQQWNANGAVNNCGALGFGFNSGGGGQDVCVKNTYRVESVIDPFTPLPVFPLGEGPTCTTAPLLGSLMPSYRFAS